MICRIKRTEKRLKIIIPTQQRIPNKTKIKININKIQVIYPTFTKASLIELIIKVIGLDQRKTFVNLITRKILNTLKNDN